MTCYILTMGKSERHCHWALDFIASGTVTLLNVATKGVGAHQKIPITAPTPQVIWGSSGGDKNLKIGYLWLPPVFFRYNLPLWQRTNGAAGGVCVPVVQRACHDAQNVASKDGGLQSWMGTWEMYLQSDSQISVFPCVGYVYPSAVDMPF